jgi:Ubiquitin-2 like Rad60 SUMO-like
MTRAFSTAIGPSSDQPMPIPKDDCTGPTLMITLLLTTGARHPFKIDPKYLLKRNVDVQGNDPFNLSVYKLKELILREWRDGMPVCADSKTLAEMLTIGVEWEQKPSSPSSIRLISFGKLLDDKAPLKGKACHLSRLDDI